MKNIYTTALAVIITLTASAQNFSYPVGQNLVDNVDNLNYESYQIDINTPSSEAIQYDWELVSNTFPANWSYSLCDYGGCAVGVPPSGSMTPISLAEAETGVIGWFKMNLTVGEFLGSGKVEIYVYDASDYNRGDVVSWDISWNGNFLSVNKLDASTPSFFPNPANDNLNVKVDGPFTGVIYNSLGETAIGFDGNSSSTINTSSLKSGIYFVSINSSIGLSKHKLIIK
tara:strand:- start:2863 stop:3546 length:684 start_codon:yes stop_codon:yes gene_type:complete